MLVDLEQAVAVVELDKLVRLEMVVMENKIQ